MAESPAAAIARMDVAGRAQVASRPGYAMAMRRYFEAWLAPQAESAVSRSLRNMSHYMCAIWVFCLDAGPGGLTFSRLSALLGRSGVSAAKRARPILIYLRFIGYIEPAAVDDARVKRWEPTARMLAAFRRRMVEDLTVFAPLDAAIGAVLERFDDPAVFGRFMAAMGEISVEMLAEYGPRADPLNVFSQRMGGMALMAELLLAGGPDGGFPPTGPVRFSLAGLARRNRVSRMHVRRVLAEAETAGLLTLSGDSEIVWTPIALVRTVDLFAYTVLTYGHCARAALEESP
ncbi:hypothetical protein QO010_003955 [Caulobacter ginsengisoli]|uniref:MarR family transcriptional regulator n=1 Tax=Caulobacter ginsengisoli TaxID=400775 RepID=A0ABU0IVY1_9CAUL|nr:hypothetical protein [Caulobacter ginsengisoli]MDQ0466162.1 hypothetical protein [Caulobacter ginsengisoli]